MPTAQRHLTPRRPVPAERAAGYVEQGYWDDRLLRDGVEAAAHAHPHGLAVVDNRASLTWSQLAGRVASATAAFRRCGVTAGQAVVLVGGNTAESLIAYHGLLRAGAVAVVLDRRCGTADLRSALQLPGVAAAVMPQREIPRLQPACDTCPVFSTERLTDPDQQEAGGGGGFEEPDRNAVALVLFTSGTTNRPKGVVHSLNTLTAGARNMALVTGASRQSVLYLISPLTSIAGIMQLHLAADQHATLVLEDDFEPGRTLERINRCQATLLGGAPVIMQRLVEAADASPDRHLSLHTVALGGSMLPRPLLDRLVAEYGIRVARVYGSSEAPNTTGSLPGDDLERCLADDGALLPGSEIRAGSAEHPREGLVRGPNVFLGYIDEADNSAAFEEDWFRTGDLVELAHGRLTVTGRLKEIANRNGLKISLAEVDAALEGLEGVGEAAAFAVPDETTGERVAVAVRFRDLADGANRSLEDLTARLRAAGLADRKLPEQLVIWDGPLPRTPSGKVIRGRLAMEAPARPTMVAARLKPEAGSG